MALKDAFVNIASAQAGKIASGFVGGIVGGIFGSNRPKVRGKTGTGPTQSKFSTKMLMYPSDVAEDEMQGHYIMFSARVADPGKLAKDKTKANAFAALAPNADVDIEGEFEGDISGLSGETKAKLLSAARKPGKSLTAKKMASSRVASTISLYMPPMVQVAYANKYGEQEIGYLAAAGGALIGDVSKFINQNSLAQLTGSMDGAATVMKNFGVAALNSVKKSGSSALAGARETAIKGIDSIAPGARALISLSAGRVKTPHMELMFEGVARRTFTYAFVFIPKSRQESETIKEIIDTFKKHMTPNFSGKEDSTEMFGINQKVTSTQQFRSMDIPDTFQINYMYRTVENQYINKISECYLQQMDVQFGGDKFSAHDASSAGTPGAPPSRVTCNLTFQEINIIDRDMIEAGY